MVVVAEFSQNYKFDNPVAITSLVDLSGWCEP